MALSITNRLYSFDRDMREQHGVIIGTDEVGRGPLAGPVVAAAVTLDLESEIEGIRDSKKLSESKREELFDKIRAGSIALKATVILPKTIDQINILQASLLAMYRSIKPLKGWDYILVDGNREIPQLESGIQQTIVKGDDKSASIAAASIVAKVVHDRILRVYHKRWPHYNFASNKGYPTKEHREAIVKYGITPVHRISFCENFLSKTTFI